MDTKYKVIITPTAYKEINKIYDYISEDLYEENKLEQCTEEKTNTSKRNYSTTENNEKNKNNNYLEDRTKSIALANDGWVHIKEEQIHFTKEENDLINKLYIQDMKKYNKINKKKNKNRVKDADNKSEKECVIY